MLTAAALHFASYDIVRQPIVTDTKLYLYFAGQVADGAVPYRDYFDNKTPLAAFVGAALMRVADLLRIDRLVTVRVAYLGLATLGGAVLFATLYHLAGRCVVAGWIGLLCHCGFSLIGLLPAVGNTPKVLTFLLAGTAMLCVHRHWWMPAGVCAALAGLDWQAGWLAIVGILCAAVFADRRRTAFLRSVAGIVLGLVPVVIYFAYHRALGLFYRYCVLATLGRVEADPISLTERVRDRIVKTMRLDCNGEWWLIVAAIAGMLIFVLWLRRRRKQRVLPMAVGLAGYHYGIVAFSLIDFQRHGDLYILLGSLSFFAAVALAAWHRRMTAWLARRVSRSVMVTCSWAVVLALVLLTRPSVLSGGLRLNAPAVDGRFTLQDQRAVAKRVATIVGSGPILCLHQQELLVLNRWRNAVPYIYYNAAAHAAYETEGRDFRQALTERLARSATGVIVVPRLAWLEGSLQQMGYRKFGARAADGTYAAVVWTRRDLPEEW